jgi:hypothetical protein
LIGDESNALRRMSPRRNRWPELAELDRRADEISIRRQRLVDRIAELEQEIAQATVTDREALAGWAVKQKGARPQPTVPGLEAKRDQARAEADALGLALADILAEKDAFVAKHRGRLVKDADKATQAARERYKQAVAVLRGAREELIAMREAAVWAALYPREEVTHSLPTTALMAGLRNPSRHHLGVDFQLSAQQVFGALEADADILSTLAAPGQAEALGRPDPKKALWGNSDEARERDKQEKQQAIDAYTREWGVPPPEY